MPKKLPKLQDWTFTVDYEGIAWAVFDRKGESMNSLGRRPTEELSQIVEAVVMPVVVGLFLIWFARLAHRKGWTR